MAHDPPLVTTMLAATFATLATRSATTPRLGETCPPVLSQAVASTAAVQEGTAQRQAQTGRTQDVVQSYKSADAAAEMVMPGAALDRVLQQLLKQDDERSRQLARLAEAVDAVAAQQASLTASVDGLKHQLEQARARRSVLASPAWG